MEIKQRQISDVENHREGNKPPTPESWMHMSEGAGQTEQTESAEQSPQTQERGNGVPLSGSIATRTIDYQRLTRGTDESEKPPPLRHRKLPARRSKAAFASSARIQIRFHPLYSLIFRYHHLRDSISLVNLIQRLPQVQ